MDYVCNIRIIFCCCLHAGSYCTVNRLAHWLKCCVNHCPMDLLYSMQITQRETCFTSHVLQQCFMWDVGGGPDETKAVKKNMRLHSHRAPTTVRLVGETFSLI